MSDRCASHPARPAHDHCPICTRPRCQPDAVTFGSSGCPVCTTTGPAGRASRAAGQGELRVRAALAGLAIAYVGGWVATQYVRVHLMSLAAPAVVGVGAARAVTAAGARRVRPAALSWGLALAAALLGTALGFVLTPGGEDPLQRWSLVAGPYLAAVAGVAAGRLVFGPARRDQPGDGEAVETRSGWY